MEQVNNTEIKCNFGTERKPVKARCWDGNGLSSWQDVEICQNTDEGKSIISIGRVTNVIKEPSNCGERDAGLFFLLEDIPSLIATLTKVAEDSQKTEFQNQVNWQLNELKKGV